MMAVHLELNKPSTVVKPIVHLLKRNCPHDEGIPHKKSHATLNSTQTQGLPNQANGKQ